MNLLLALVIISLEFYRAPQPIDIATIDREIVWVYFTDKGFRTESEYYQVLSEYTPRLSPEAQRRRLAALGRLYDYDDLPVYAPYLEELISYGAKLRIVSNWLNAASFYIPKALLPQIANLPYVYDIKPVATDRVTHEELSVLEVKDQTADTSYYRELYNLTYEQNYMLGVPQVFTRGYTGSGVKLAILDTGLKRRKHNALRSLRIYKEHDFLSGDDIFIKRPYYEVAQPIPELANQKMIQALRFVRDSQNRLYLFFSADSFTPAQARPARLLMSYSDNLGEDWSLPQALYSTVTYNISIPNIAAAAKDSVVYYLWQELIPQAPNVPINNLYFSYLINAQPHPHTSLGAGKNPAVTIKDDVLAISYVTNDSVLYFRKADITAIVPSFYSPQLVETFTEAIADPWVFIDSLNEIEILVRGLRTQKLYHFTSTDDGLSFNFNSELDSQVGKTSLVIDNHKIYLVYKKYLAGGRSALVLRTSTDGASTWSNEVSLVNNALALGDFSFTVQHDTIKLVYESHNDIYLCQIYQDAIIAVETLAQNFSYAPRILNTTAGSAIVYVRRGDDDTDYEEGEDFLEQPNHGTHMASIIAGYLPKTFIGVAPAVDLIIAKTELHKALSGYIYETIIEEDLWVSGLEWAEKVGAQIISSSLGYRSWYTEKDYDGRTIPVSVAADLAAKRGVVVVSAMGNAPLNFFPWPSRYIVAPGDAFEIITAGGVKRDSSPWRSQTSATGLGPTFDGRIKPDLVALADAVTIVNPDDSSEYLASSGTSCATALIAGLCALILEAHPSWSADSVKLALFSTASLPVPNCTLGWGIPNVDSVLKVYPARAPSFTRNVLAAPYPVPFVVSRDQKIFFPFYLMKTPRWAELRIYSLTGELIKTINLSANDISVPGRYIDKATLTRIGAYWDGTNQEGNFVSSGIYFVVLETSFGRDRKTFALVR